MENNPHKLAEKLIMDRQGILLHTFYKTIMAITPACPSSSPAGLMQPN